MGPRSTPEKRTSTVNPGPNGQRYVRSSWLITKVSCCFQASSVAVSALTRLRAPKRDAREPASPFPLLRRAHVHAEIMGDLLPGRELVRTR